MPRTRIMLIVPGPGEASEALAAAGTHFPPQVPPGTPAEVEFERISAHGLDELCETLVRDSVPHVVLNESRLDPSACTPSPASLRIVCPGLLTEVGVLLLPLRFPMPGFDRETLLAAGLPERDVDVVVALFDPRGEAVAFAA